MLYVYGCTTLYLRLLPICHTWLHKEHVRFTNYYKRHCFTNMGLGYSAFLISDDLMQLKMHKTQQYCQFAALHHAKACLVHIMINSVSITTYPRFESLLIIPNIKRLENDEAAIASHNSVYSILSTYNHQNASVYCIWISLWPHIQYMIQIIYLHKN